MVIQQTVHNLEQGDVALPDTGRPVVRSNEGVISSGHYLTSMAGMKMLMAGGNAFDAMVAASLAAAVVEPIASYSLLAEGVFMLYDSASGDLTSLTGRAALPPQRLQIFPLPRPQAIPTGPGLDAPLSFTQPGIVTPSLPCWSDTAPCHSPRWPPPPSVTPRTHSPLRVHAGTPEVRVRTGAVSTTSRPAVGMCSTKTARFRLPARSWCSPPRQYPQNHARWRPWPNPAPAAPASRPPATPSTAAPSPNNSSIQPGRSGAS